MAGDANTSFVSCRSLSLDLGDCGGPGACSGVPIVRPGGETYGMCTCESGWRGSLDLVLVDGLQCDVSVAAISWLWGVVVFMTLLVYIFMISKLSPIIFEASIGFLSPYGLSLHDKCCCQLWLHKRAGNDSPFCWAVFRKAVFDRMGQLFLLAIVSSSCLATVGFIKILRPGFGLCTPQLPGATIIFWVGASCYWTASVLYLYRWSFMSFASPLIRGISTHGVATRLLWRIKFVYRLALVWSWLVLAVSILGGLIPDLPDWARTLLLGIHLQGLAISLLIMGVVATFILGDQLMREAGKSLREENVQNSLLISRPHEITGSTISVQSAPPHLSHTTSLEVTPRTLSQAPSGRATSSRHEAAPSHHEAAPSHHEAAPSHHEAAPSHHEAAPSHHEAASRRFDHKREPSALRISVQPASVTIHPDLSPTVPIGKHLTEVIHQGVLRTQRQRKRILATLDRFWHFRMWFVRNSLQHVVFMMIFVYWDFLRSKIDWEIPISWALGHVLVFQVLGSLNPPRRVTTAPAFKDPGRTVRNNMLCGRVQCLPGPKQGFLMHCVSHIVSVFCWTCMTNPKLPSRMQVKCCVKLPVCLGERSTPWKNADNPSSPTHRAYRRSSRVQSEGALDLFDPPS
jgi:hypothetical protein